MLLHELGHIKADKRLGSVEQLLREQFYKLGLADSGRSDEDKRRRAAARINLHSAALYRGADEFNCLILTDKLRFEMLFHIGKAGKVALHYLICGYACPELDNSGDVTLRHRIVGGERLQRFDIFLFGGDTAFDFEQTLVVGILGLLHHRLLAVVEELEVVLGGLEIADALVSEVRASACLIEQVDSLIGQEAVIYIALGEHNRSVDERVAYGDLVEIFVIVLDADEHLIGLLYRRLLDFYRLKAALKGGVLLDIFSVFGEGRCADYLYLASRKGGLQDIRGVHRALRIACADEVMHLIDEQDYIALFFDLVYKTLYTALELTSELSTGDKSGEVEQVYFLFGELRGNFAIGYTQGKSLGYSGLADAGFADKAGVVLRAAAENLHRAVNLVIASDDAVYFTLSGFFREIRAIEREELSPLFLLAFFLFARTLGVDNGDAERTDLGFVIVAVALVDFILAVGVLILFIVVLLGLVHERKSSRAAGHEACSVLAEQLIELVADGIHLVLRDAHALHYLLYGTYIHFHGAFHAESFLLGLVALDLGYEEHCRAFAAPGTHHLFHLNNLRDSDLTFIGTHMIKHR